MSKEIKILICRRGPFQDFFFEFSNTGILSEFFSFRYIVHKREVMASYFAGQYFRVCQEAQC